MLHSLSVLIALVAVIGISAVGSRATTSVVGDLTAAATPRVTFSVAKSHYLSSESPTGSIEINNTTDGDLYFYSTSVVFLIRDASGHVREDRWITTISHNITPFVILPGKQETVSVPVPKCSVTSDPCAEHVSIRLSVAPMDGKETTITTNEQSYTFDPDPSATFQVDGLEDNRPLFMTQGEATATITPIGAQSLSASRLALASQFDPLFSQANDQAKDMATQLAAFLQAGSCEDASGLTGSSMLLRFAPFNSGGLNRAPWVTHDDLILNEVVRASLESSAGRTLSVDARLNRGCAGATAVSPRQNPFGSSPQTSEFFFLYTREFAWMSLSASIAADRPEIFAVVRLQHQSCDRLGYNCRAVAFMLASDRVRALARSLGVRVAYVSLVAAYLDKQWSDRESVLPMGVAMTMVGQPQALLKPAPSRSPLAPRGMVAPHVRPTGMLRGLFTPTPDIVPISVPDSTTTLEALGDVGHTIQADALRIDVRIDAANPNSNQSAAPDPGTVVSKLLTEPTVVDAASQIDRLQKLPAGYELVVRTYNLAQIRRLILLIRAHYKHVNIAVKYQVASALSNCDEEIVRAQAESAKAAMKSAIEESDGSNRRLRKLVLVAAYPPNAPDACAKGAQLNPLDRAGIHRLQIPTDRAVRIDVPVKLVFRTFPSIDEHH